MDHIKIFNRLPKSVKIIHIKTSELILRKFKINSQKKLFWITTLIWLSIILLFMLKVMDFLRIMKII